MTELFISIGATLGALAIGVYAFVTLMSHLQSAK